MYELNKVDVKEKYIVINTIKKDITLEIRLFYDYTHYSSLDDSSYMGRYIHTSIDIVYDGAQIGPCAYDSVLAIEEENKTQRIGIVCNLLDFTKYNMDSLYLVYGPDKKETYFNYDVEDMIRQWGYTQEESKLKTIHHISVMWHEYSSPSIYLSLVMFIYFK